QSPDNNYDGIVDLAYEIPGDAGAKDYYPLTYIPLAPTTPLELNATPGNKFVHLEWKEPLYCGASNITGYKIYRATEPEAWEFVGSTTALNYTDKNLTNGITYYYYVTATNSNGESRKSNIVNATPGELPGIPVNFTATGYENKVVLRWEMPETDMPLLGYKIYRSTFSHWQGLYAEIGNVSEFVDYGVASGTVYYYRISGVNAKGEGEMSLVVPATVSTLNVSIVAEQTCLQSGENTTITVYVERNTTHEAMQNAYVVLSMQNLSGNIEKTEGYTDEHGRFRTEFIAGNPEIEENGTITATVFAENYSVVKRSVSLAVKPDIERKGRMQIFVMADDKLRNNQWELVVYVKDLDSGEAIENASVEVNVSGVKSASKVTEKDGRAVFEFVLDNRETESLEIMINANKNGYENASTFLRLGLSR
ncbi:MAG: fibronectin type III domain-containing protein, partial [Thermoplasmata archaeon]